MNSDRAAEIIRDECADCSVRIQHVVGVNLDCLFQNSPMTMDLRIDRVRIFVDDDNIVVEEPRRG